MNFIYISPQFPRTYWNFCDRLKRNGVTVLGIGDTPYDQLSHETRSALDEYYYVTNMEDEDEMLRAVAFLTFKYGKIDWLESNNEYWMNQDARLREAFHITSGYMGDAARWIQHKSHMKAYYEKAGIATARWELATTLDQAKKFVDTVHYPIIVKPDIGVGAAATYKITTEQELTDFFAHLPEIPYIMEEFISGYICSFDGITNSKKEILFYTSHVFPTPIMEIVQSQDHLVYYSEKELPQDLLQAGRRAVEAFPCERRFFHFEFFRMMEDKEGLGKAGDLIGLEVNMRPPGGYTPDMMNFANQLDVYQIWADMVCWDTSDIDTSNRPYICVFASRRDTHTYRHTHEEIMNIYRDFMMMEERMPEVLADAMGNQMYTACFATMDEVKAFVAFVQEETGGK